jgi:LmbE family N-acetylglucosaminyl deacetylase
MDYKTILVFGAHPDDELTMAGTMAKLAESGVRVVVVQMTDGSEGYPRPEMRERIVAMRREEAEAANMVIGIARRVYIGSPDMGLVNDKATLKKCIQAIREEKPDAIFTHGPDDYHRDHIATHAIAIDARWHAGEPVVAELGPSWKTPHLYYYKGVARRELPTITIDVSATAHKRFEALATQVSQHTLFRRTKEEFLAEATRIKHSGGRYTETFWLAERNQISDFLPKGL